MSENPTNPREPEPTPQDEGVALSPYDSDLRRPEGEPDTGEFELPTPAGYDDPEFSETDAPLEAGAPVAPAPRFEPPEWASFREPEQPADEATDLAMDPAQQEEQISEQPVDLEAQPATPREPVEREPSPTADETLVAEPAPVVEDHRGAEEPVAGTVPAAEAPTIDGEPVLSQDEALRAAEASPATDMLPAPEAAAEGAAEVSERDAWDAEFAAAGGTDAGGTDAGATDTSAAAGTADIGAAAGGAAAGALAAGTAQYAEADPEDAVAAGTAEYAEADPEDAAPVVSAPAQDPAVERAREDEIRFAAQADAAGLADHIGDAPADEDRADVAPAVGVIPPRQSGRRRADTLADGTPVDGDVLDEGGDAVVGDGDTRTLGTAGTAAAGGSAAAGAGAAGAAFVGAAAAGAAQPGVAGGDAEASEDALATQSLATDSVSDTAVRRTSLLRPERTELPSNEPVALREAAEADPRVDNYGTTVHPDDDALFEGAQYDRVPSRVGAHLWGVLAMILLIPIAWYLITDAGARMTLPENAQWTTGTMNIAALAELVAGIVVLVVALLFARASSVGAWVMGVLLTIVGGAFVVVPGIAKDLITPAQEWLRGVHAGLGGNIAHHLEADGSTGRLLILGIILIMVALVSSGARRRGRDEQRIRAAVERRQARLEAQRPVEPVEPVQ
ncbi:MAG TPA: hypothetical protein GX743_05110 [Actinomycetales bacterium]|nr:hypothetical protein [Actinomycetales bacterium]